MHGIKTSYPCGRWGISFARQIERAWQQPSRLRRNAITASDHEATCFTADKPRRASCPEELRSPKRGLRQLGDLASYRGKRRLNIDRSWSAQSRRGVDNSRKRGRHPSAAVYQKDIRCNIYIASRTAKSVGENATVVQDQGLGIFDVDVAATTNAAFYRGRDLRVRHIDEVRCIQSDVTAIGRDCTSGDTAAGHGDLIARIDRDVAGETTARELLAS